VPAIAASAKVAESVPPPMVIAAAASRVQHTQCTAGAQQWRARAACNTLCIPGLKHPLNELNRCILVQYFNTVFSRDYKKEVLY